MSIHVLFQKLVSSLLLTIIIEEILAFLLKVRKKKDILLIFLVNVVTNPVVVLSYDIFHSLFPWNQYVLITVLEISAVLCEAMYYKRFGQQMKHPVILSIVLNGVSFLIGNLLYN